MQSHIHALGQCRRIIRELGVSAEVAADTAGSARFVAELGDPKRAALAPRLAAEIYGLDILRENVEDEAHNTTRFVILSREAAARRPATARSSPPSSSASATCRPRSTRRSAASPRTAST